jgi:predicted HNH restriction endonuclease
MTYREHLQSQEWQDIRARELARAGYCCEYCWKRLYFQAGGRLGLHVHHLTYERLGSEPSSDLMVLCASCHAEVHTCPRFRNAVRSVAVSRPQTS